MAASRILVVDQEPYTRAVIATMLEKSNYLPVLATDGHEAMAHIEQDAPFDVVLSDIMIHGVDGIGLLDKLREIHPDTPMVMVTAMQDVGIAISAMRRGAYDYLLKPFAREQLLATIERALDYRRLVQQNSMYRQNLEELVSARTEMLRERGYELDVLEQDAGIIFAVRRARLDFRAPARFNDLLRVETRVVSKSPVRMGFQQIIAVGDRMLCSGEVEVVCLDVARFRPHVIPADLLQAVPLSVQP